MSGAPLPEGVEVDVVVYFHSPSLDVNIALRLGGFTFLPDIASVADHQGKQTATLLDATDWRRMTRDEIEAYKTDHEADG
jgi:hypothetical protein